MFHYILKYKKMYFYQEHPVIKFDTIYQTGYWKVFSVFLTNGTSVKEPLFDYTVSEFKDNEEFLDFVYKLRVRSLYNIDTVDLNENDQLLTLSTCTYEVKNYRLVIVARRVREGEDLTVDTESVTENPEPLYPYSYYYDYGGKAPKIPETFIKALAEDKITWYKPAGDKTDTVPSK
jgi:sortase B